MNISLSKAKAMAKNPGAYGTPELHEALDVIVNDDRLTETQVTNLQNKIETALRTRVTLPTTYGD